MSDTNEITFEDVKNSPRIPDSEAREPGFVDDVRNEIYDLIVTIQKQTRDGTPAAIRAGSIAITHLETAMMWAVRARFL